MANIYKGWLCEKSLKTPLLATHLIYFEFKSKPSLITVISMDPRPTNYLRQNIVFSYPKMIRVSFSLFLSLSGFCYFTLLSIFMKIILLLLLFIFFHENYFYFSCSGMFRDVPECSGMFHVPGFIDALPTGMAVRVHFTFFVQTSLHYVFFCLGNADSFNICNFRISCSCSKNCFSTSSLAFLAAASNLRDLADPPEEFDFFLSLIAA